MSNITAVIAAILDAAGLSSLSLARDETSDRDTTKMPYAVSREGISTTRSTASGRGVRRLVELVQIDLFQNRNAAPDNPALMKQIWDALDAAGPQQITGADAASVYRIQPQASVRFYDRTTQIVTESLTVRVTRNT